jgi:Zn-dependent peptidase ImmA (M78 family)
LSTVQYRVMTLTYVRALAEELAARYNPGKLAPFPYENILQDHPELEIYFTDLDDQDVSGVSFCKDGTCTIIVNADKPVVRQNFTLGHELGHYFLHREVLTAEEGIIDGDGAIDGIKSLYRLADSGTDSMEVQANSFAASLLMPTDLVREGWRQVGEVEKLARIFQVSTIAMSVRLTQLGLVE